MEKDKESILTAIRGLAEELGEVKGGFRGLKEYIETQTAECRFNYKELNKSFHKVSGRLNGITKEDEVEDKLRRRSTDNKRFLYSTITLCCAIIMTLVTVLEVDRWKSAQKTAQKSSGTAYTREDARKDQLLVLRQIRELIKGIGH